MSEVIKREFQAELHASGDGRTLDVRIVPYNTLQRVSDGPDMEYDEMWMPGAFDKQLNAANRVDVLANFEHQKGIAGVIARGTHLEDTSEGLDGTFRMLNHSDADKALELVNEGVLTGISLEAIPTKTVREDGVVKRVKARLVNIALCRFPAYPQAQVMAVREAPEEEAEEEHEDNLEQIPGQEEIPIEPEAEPEERTSEVDAALERLGYEPLLTRAITKKPWDGSAARFSDEEYVRSCLIDRGGDAPPKERCSLPVLEPNGDLNVNALGAAAGRLSQTSAPGDLKAKAARKLVRYYNKAKMEPPASLRMMAAR